jgi:hypothetical protein
MQTKEFGDHAKAHKEYEKLIREKLEKGYEELGSEDADDDEDSEDDDADDAAAVAYRIGISYDENEEGVQWVERLNEFLDRPGSEKTKALVVGPWGNMCEGDDSAGVIEALAGASHCLPNLTAIFLGDVTFEDCEISWINQSDVSPIFDAYPNLKHFRVRGGNELKLGAINHSGLQSLVIEAGGLPKQIIHDVIASRLPALQHLELWLGSDSYGADATVEDLKPICYGNLFPKLKYLGLRNSEIADEIAQSLKGAPIMNQIEVLDLSMSTLSDLGGQALLENPAIERLKKLDIHYHFLSEQMTNQFRKLPIAVDVDDRQEFDPSDEFSRYCAVSE